MSTLRGICGLLRLALAHHRVRPRDTLLLASGFAIASLTLILLLAIPAGLERLGGQTGLDDVVIVFSAGAADEAGSALQPAIVALLGDLPGVARDADGKPRVAPQFLAQAKLRGANGETASVLVRGVTPTTLALIDDVSHLSDGAAFSRGINEALVGSAVARAFVDAAPGASVKIRESVWRVSGRFDGGGLWESEVWTDIAPLQATFNTASAISVAWVKLDSTTALGAFEKAVDADPRLRDVRVEGQRDYYSRQVRFLTRFIRIAAAGIAAALALGAMLAVANALTLVLISRRREIAVLRALGFGNVALTSALLIEIQLIGLAVAGLSLGLGELVLDGRQIATSTGHQAIDFALALTPEVAAWALVYVLLIGLTSAFFPARRAVHAPLLAALGGR